jgi:hypothetical protein
MLSEKEHNHILNQLNQPSSTISSTTKKNLRKKLKEHEYATKLAPFDPLPHIPYFINRTTSEKMLHQLIRAATMSTEFTIDTESWNVFRQTNKPALIQLQIFLPRDSSFVLLIEVCHLPKEDNIVFKLIQQLFQIILTSKKKKIFIFGQKDELYPFIQFNLFSHDHIQNIKTINLQDQFKMFWNKYHPHQSISSTALNNSSDCICEKCIGKNPSEPWSLQDCVAYLLHENLPKTLSNENFQIGLDPKLFELNDNEEQYRNRLSTYAKNDCLSMQRLIIQMKNQQFDFDSSSNIPTPIRKNKSRFTLPKLYDELESISSDDDYLNEEQITYQILFSKNSPTPSIDNLEQNNEDDTQYSMMIHTQEQILTEDAHENRYPFDWESNAANENCASVNHEHQAAGAQLHQNPNELSTDERKRIHNKTCTRKQRDRYYKNKIIIKNFDRRFTINEIKSILKYENIPFYLVNKPKSKITGLRELHIAIRDVEQISVYERRTRNMFTTKQSKEFHRMKRLIQNNYREPIEDHQHHRQHHHHHDQQHQYQQNHHYHRQPHAHHHRPHHRTSSYHHTSSNYRQSSHDRQEHQHRK